MSAPTPQDQAKMAAGRKAVEVYARDGMRLGLGSGTTSHFFVRALAVQVEQGLDIVGVPTSTATRDLARRIGGFEDLTTCPDLTGRDRFLLARRDDHERGTELMSDGSERLTR